MLERDSGNCNRRSVNVLTQDSHPNVRRPRRCRVINPAYNYRRARRHIGIWWVPRVTHLPAVVRLFSSRTAEIDSLDLVGLPHELDERQVGNASSSQLLAIEHFDHVLHR